MGSLYTFPRRLFLRRLPKLSKLSISFFDARVLSDRTSYILVLGFYAFLSLNHSSLFILSGFSFISNGILRERERKWISEWVGGWVRCVWVCMHNNVLSFITTNTIFTVCILLCYRIYIFRIKAVKHNKCILDSNVLLKPLFCYKFRSHRSIITQINIGICLGIALLVRIHASATRHVYMVTELPQDIKILQLNICMEVISVYLRHSSNAYTFAHISSLVQHWRLSINDIEQCPYSASSIHDKVYFT
jgi:hypothetical protein